MLHGIDPVQARALLDEALTHDPTSFMAYLPQKG
jgi:Tfp pilus assembly protein PilF